MTQIVETLPTLSGQNSNDSTWISQHVCSPTVAPKDKDIFAKNHPSKSIYNDTLSEETISSDEDTLSTTAGILSSSRFSSSGNTIGIDANWYESIPKREFHEDFLKDIINFLLEEAVFDSTERNCKVIEWRQPEVLKKMFDLNLPAEPESHDSLFDSIRQTVAFSVKTGHPHFANQLFSALDPYGLAGQWVIDALNTSLYTYEMTPVFSLVEEKVLQEMRQRVGYPDGAGDGIFCPGGSMANAFGINCARYYACPEVKSKGLHCMPRMVFFMSDHAHYSSLKMAALLGLGEEAAIKVPTDKYGRMDVKALDTIVQDAIFRSWRPFLVVATAGTTVLGAIDPLEGISDVCRKYKLWFHVDAAWGGGLLISSKHKNKLAGIERSDSVTWNPHKLLAAPQQCSAFLTRHTNVLSEAHCAKATYLFQPDKCYDITYDVGDKHVQCGRKVDSFKFWFMWRAKGTSGLERHVDHIMDLALYLRDCVKSRTGFQLVLEEPEVTNVCFWYIPPSLRGHEKDDDYQDKLHKIAALIKGRMLHFGTMMVTYQPLGNLPNFFRLVLQNSGTRKEDMEYFLNEIEELGKDL